MVGMTFPVIRVFTAPPGNWRREAVLEDGIREKGAFFLHDVFLIRT